MAGRRRNVFADRFLTQLEGDPPGDAVIRKEVMALYEGIVLENKSEEAIHNMFIDFVENPMENGEPRESVNKRTLCEDYSEEGVVIIDVEKDLDETELQDAQCPALCRGLSRRGPGLICGRRCCLRYGHSCTHRCDEHWD